MLKCFEPVQSNGAHEFEELLSEGQLEKALLTLEWWSYSNQRDLLYEQVVSNIDKLPAVADIYLAEMDAAAEHDAIMNFRENDHIPVANLSRCRRAINTMSAPYRYYFSEKLLGVEDVTGVRRRIKTFKAEVPERNLLWDVLLASTLKVSDKKTKERVVDLCRPAIRAISAESVDSLDLGLIALGVVFRAAVSAQDATLFHKSLESLHSVHGLPSGEDREVFASLLEAGPNRTKVELEPIPLSKTTQHLANIYRAVVLSEGVERSLDALGDFLNKNPWHEILGGAVYRISLSILVKPLFIRVTDDLIATFIRKHLGPINKLDQLGRRLSAMCFVMGASQTAGMGKDEKKSALADLTKDTDEAWAHRGFARRKLATNPGQCMHLAVQHLTRSYQFGELKPQQSDPLYLWLHVGSGLSANIETLLSAPLAMDSPRAFNQMMHDLVYPFLQERPIPGEDGVPSYFRYSKLSAHAIVEIARHQWLEADLSLLSDILYAVSDINSSQIAFQIALEWAQRGVEPNELLNDALFLLDETFDAQEAIDALNAAKLLAYDDEILSEIDDKIREYEAEIEAAIAARPDPASHWALFDPSEKPENRKSLNEACLKEAFELGVIASYLAAPNGQALNPFGTTPSNFGIRPHGWSATLKRLIQSGLLQIRVDSPEGSFSIEEGGALTWTPEDVELAVNVRIEGIAGRNQAGILASLDEAIQERVREADPKELVELWQMLVERESLQFYFDCLEHFELPTRPTGDEEDIFEGKAQTYSLSELMNLTYNSCNYAAGQQSAKKLAPAHARNMAKKITADRIARARGEGWNIKPGYRLPNHSAPYIVQYFYRHLTRLGASNYAESVPNIESLAGGRQESTTT